MIRPRRQVHTEETSVLTYRSKNDMRHLNEYALVVGCKIRVGLEDDTGQIVKL